MKKRIIAAVLLFVAVAVVVLIYTASNLGPLITSAVNIYGPKMTGTEVRLGNARVSLLSGQVHITNLMVGNPPGFKSPRALAVASVYMDVDESSLAGNPVIIERIEVISPEIAYEKRGGTDNFKTILAGIKKSSRKPIPAPQVKKEPARKMLIRDLVIRNGSVTLANALSAGEVISADLPEIHLTNVGGARGGASPEEVFGTIVAELYRGITAPSVLGTMNAAVKGLGSGAESAGSMAQKQAESAGNGISKGVRSVTGALKGLVGD